MISVHKSSTCRTKALKFGNQPRQIILIVTLLTECYHPDQYPTQVVTMEARCPSGQGLFAQNFCSIISLATGLLGHLLQSHLHASASHLQNVDCNTACLYTALGKLLAESTTQQPYAMAEHFSSKGINIINCQCHCSNEFVSS